MGIRAKCVGLCNWEIFMAFSWQQCRWRRRSGRCIVSSTFTWSIRLSGPWHFSSSSPSLTLLPVSTCHIAKRVHLPYDGKESQSSLFLLALLLLKCRQLHSSTSGFKLKCKYGPFNPVSAPFLYQLTLLFPNAFSGHRQPNGPNPGDRRELFRVAEGLPGGFHSRLLASCSWVIRIQIKSGAALKKIYIILAGSKHSLCVKLCFGRQYVSWCSFSFGVPVKLHSLNTFGQNNRPHPSCVLAAATWKSASVSAQVVLPTLREWL